MWLLGGIGAGTALVLLAAYALWTWPAAHPDKPTTPGDERAEEELRLRIVEGKHNYRVLAAPGWTLRFWTNASTYGPEHAMGMGFQLMCQSPPSAPPGEARVRARIAPVANPDAAIEAHHILALPRLGPGQVVWEARIANVFPRKDDPRGGLVEEEGRYVSDWLLTLGGGLEFHIDSVPIKVKFWHE
jgi:hypothetical protein